MTAVWDAGERASALQPRRQQLLGQLARRVPAARSLSADERELVVDDAITYTALDYPRAIGSAAEAERVFWAACELRVRRAREGRFGLLRNGWERASDDRLEQLAAPNDPVADVERVEELRLAQEFARTLSDLEAQVLRVKYFSGTPQPLGYRTIASRLGISPAAARSAERSIARNIERFSALHAAGRLCAERALELTALAAGTADPAQARRAQAHIAHCAHCKPLYVMQLRALRAASFQRRVAAVLPTPPVGDAAQRQGRLRELVADWFARLTGHDAGATAAQLSASGAGRGAGTIAAIKLAALCITGTAATIGACIATGVLPTTTHAPNAPKAARHAHAPNPPEPSPRLARLAIARTATAIPTSTPSAPRWHHRQATAAQQTRTTQGATTPTSHRQTPASPAPANAAAHGASEFNPTYQPSQPAQPAPVPAAPGGSEFP